MRKIRSIALFLRTYKFALLLITLFLQIVVPAFVENVIISRALSYIFISSTLVVSYLIFFNRGSLRYAIFIITSIALILSVHWLEYFVDSYGVIKIVRIVVLIKLFSLIFIYIFKEFGKRGRVTLDFIFGAISGFMLIGLNGAFICYLVEFFYPNSFSGTTEITAFFDYIYFSFVTVTTLGYGDVLPTSNQGEVVAITLAIVGQLYLIVIMGIIVGKYLQHQELDQTDR